MKNPYQSPATSPESPDRQEKPRLTGITIAVIIFAWLLWAVVLLSNLSGLFVASLREGPEVELQNGTNLWLSFAFGAACLLILVFGLRWLFFSFLINAKRVRPGGGGAAGLAVIGIFLIYLSAKTIDTCGLVLLLQDHPWPRCIPFAITSFIVLLIVIPNRLLRNLRQPAD